MQGLGAVGSINISKQVYYCYSRQMRNDFMQNLSDEIVRENHRLKGEVTKLSHKISDYEGLIIQVVETMAPVITEYGDPQIMLKQFIKEVGKERKEFQSLNNEHADLLRNIQSLKERNSVILKQLQLKQQEEEQNHLRWEKQKETLQSQCSLTKAEVLQLQQNFNTLKKTYNELKIQKLKVEESKRGELEQSGLQHHIQLMTMKNRIEKEHQKIQKLLREEIESKNNTIKDMSRMLEEIKSIEGRDSKSSAFLQEMFIKLQRYNELSQTIEELTEENSILRTKRQELQTMKVTMELRMRESKTAEYNLKSQIERITIEFQQLETKYIAQTAQLLKSQKEKEDMDKYYHTRWIQEYKRVKNRLNKELMEKIKEVEDTCQEKIVYLKTRTNEAIEKEHQMLKRNNYLQSIYEKDQSQKEDLKNDLAKLNGIQGQLRSIIRQVDCMKSEELLGFHLRFQAREYILNHKIQQLQNIIRFKDADFLKSKGAHQQAIMQLRKEAQYQLENQKKTFESQRKQIIAKQALEILKLQSKMTKEIQNAEQIKIQMKKEFDSMLAQRQQEYDNKLQKKEEQWQQKQQKWVDRFREMQHQNSIVVKKLKKDIETQKNELQVLEGKNQRLKIHRDELLSTIDRINSELATLQSQVASLERLAIQKDRQLSRSMQQIQRLQQQLTDSRKEVEVLINMRSDWSKELENLQFDYREEFDFLNKEAEKERNILRAKVRELQEISRRNAIIKRDYEQLKALQQQKNGLEEEVHVKQAENKILTQIKDYYESRLREAEQKIDKIQLRANHSVLARKTKRTNLNDHKESASSKIFQATHRESPEKMNETNRYTIKSYNKHYNMSLSKARLEEVNPGKKFRVKTSYAF